VNDPRSGLAMAKLHAAFRAEQQGDPSVGPLAAEAMALFDAAGDLTGAAAARQLLATALPREGRDDEAVARLEEALLLRARTGDDEGQASLLHDLVGLHLHRGDPEAARQAAGRLLEIYRRSQNRTGQANAMHQLVQLLVDGGDLDAAERMCSDALFLLDRPGDEVGRAALLVQQSRLAATRGDLDRALAVALQARQTAQHAAFRPILADAVHQLGSVHVQRGELDVGRRLLVEALDGRISVRDEEGKAATLQELAAAEAALGRIADAVGHLGDAGTVLARLGAVPAAIGALHAAMTLAEQHELVREAVAAGEALCALVEGEGMADEAAGVRYAQGARRVRLGDLEGAARDLARAVTLQADPDRVAEQAVARAMLGQVLAKLGRTDEARRELQMAHAALAPVDPDAAADVAAILSEL
jgi:tetratricopeptide (TPR) repeat protein